MMGGKKQLKKKQLKLPSALTPSKLKNLLQIVERAKYIWESTFDAILNPVMIVDKEYIIQRANVALAEVIQQDVRKLIGKACYKVFANRESPCGGCPLHLTLNTKKPTLSRIQKFSDDREYQAASYPLKGKRSDLDLYIVQYHDIREERNLQARLIQSEKMAAMGTLAGGVAHEINNPLSAILAFAQLALKQVTKDSQVYQDIKEIEISALRCKKIVENVLEFSRPSYFEEKSELNLKSLFEKVSPLLKLQVKEAGVQLETEFADSLPKIFGNSNQLEQVFLNLISNACHALLRGGKIRISTYPQDACWIRIDFSDNGSGIKKEYLSKVFDPFFTTKKSGVGTGLGLSIVYNIIQEHGGWIEVESTENQGTIFRIFLPILKSAEEQDFCVGVTHGIPPTMDPFTEKSKAQQ